MERRQFEHFVEELHTLTKRQCQKVLALLTEAARRERTAEVIEQAASTRLNCPRCAEARLYRHGHVDGLQRYRCVGCGKTFNALTGTPLARLRQKSKWLNYLDCMLVATTVRRAAQEVQVHKDTSFRWRHRFLALTKHDRPHRLSGIAEADELYLLESEKGARKLERKPRKRGGAATKRGISDEQVCVLVARDRTGQTLDFVTGKGPVTKKQLLHHLPPVLDHDVLLVTDANAAYRYFARDAGISHEFVNLNAGERVRGAIHVQNVNAYHSRFRLWLDRFHGVATHYLSNYLGWRWALDAQRIHSPDVLLRTAMGVFHT
jgi:transposase-like protein